MTAEQAKEYGLIDNVITDRIESGPGKDKDKDKKAK